MAKKSFFLALACLAAGGVAGYMLAKSNKDKVILQKAGEIKDQLMGGGCDCGCEFDGDEDGFDDIEYISLDEEEPAAEEQETETEEGAPDETPNEGEI